MSFSKAEDSIYVDDSDDQSCGNEMSRFDVNSKRTAMDTRVIGESDSEDEEPEELEEESHQALQGASSNTLVSDSGSVNSEEEDMEFMNASLKVSIKISSDSDSSPEIKQKKKSMLKRRSIYDNPVSPFTPPGINRTPMNRKLKKRPKKVYQILTTDSESENVPVNQSNLSDKNIKSAVVSDESDEEMKEVNDRSVRAKSMNYTEESDDQEMVEANNQSAKDPTDHDKNKIYSDDENSFQNLGNNSDDKENTPIHHNINTSKNVPKKKKIIKLFKLEQKLKY